MMDTKYGKYHSSERRIVEILSGWYVLNPSLRYGFQSSLFQFSLFRLCFLQKNSLPMHHDLTLEKYAPI